MGKIVLKSTVKSLRVNDGVHSPRPIQKTYEVGLRNEVVVTIRADDHKEVPIIGEPVTMTLEWDEHRK